MHAARLREALSWSGQPAARAVSADPSVDAGARPIQLRDSDASYVHAALRLTAVALLLRPMGPGLSGLRFSQ